MTAPPAVGVDAAPADVEIRRNLHAVQGRDVYPVIGALVAATALSTTIYYAIAPWSGVLGYIVLTYALFVGIFALLVSMDGNAPLVRDRIAAVAAHSFAFILVLTLVVVVVYILWRGREPLTHLNFFVRDLGTTGPLDSLDSGGILHGIAGTLIMITISLSVTIPLGIGCAVFLAETRGGFTRFVRTIVEAMTALPSIVAGLFVYAAIITLYDAIGVGQKSGLAAALALSVMMLPIIIRAADVVLRLVPGTLKEAASALGAPRWRVVWHVVLPTARSGLMTAIILATARGVGETSPVLLTAGYAAATNVNPLSGPMVSLPLLTFRLTSSSEANFVARGFGAAAVLMLIVLVLFVVARTIGGRPAGELSKAQARRRASQSLGDQRRFEALRRAREQAARAPETAVQP